jgi:hypothetical protein
MNIKRIGSALELAPDTDFGDATRPTRTGTRGWPGDAAIALLVNVMQSVRKPWGLMLAHSFRSSR